MILFKWIIHVQYALRRYPAPCNIKTNMFACMRVSASTAAHTGLFNWGLKHRGGPIFTIVWTSLQEGLYHSYSLLYYTQK